jgi:hypothetical protein
MELSLAKERRRIRETLKPYDSKQVIVSLSYLRNQEEIFKNKRFWIDLERFNKGKQKEIVLEVVYLCNDRLGVNYTPIMINGNYNPLLHQIKNLDERVLYSNPFLLEISKKSSLIHR